MIWNKIEIRELSRKNDKVPTQSVAANCEAFGCSNIDSTICNVLVSILCKKNCSAVLWEGQLPDGGSLFCAIYYLWPRIRCVSHVLAANIRSGLCAVSGGSSQWLYYVHCNLVIEQTSAEYFTRMCCADRASIAGTGLGNSSSPLVLFNISSPSDSGHLWYYKWHGKTDWPVWIREKI